MIKNFIDFEAKFSETFGNIARNTLSGVKHGRVRLELTSENRNSKDGSKPAIDRALQVLDYCFGKQRVWLRVILWGEDEESNMVQAGFDIDAAIEHFRQRSEDEVLYLELAQYSEKSVKPVVTSVVNYEMAEDPCANITCYYVNFDERLVINIYDDRGMDVVSKNVDLLAGLSKRFSDWITH